MEKDLTRNENCLAMAGIDSAYYADINTIDNILPVSDGLTVSFKQGKTWHIIEHDTASANSPHEAGRGYRQTVDLVFHGNQTEVSRDLDAMCDCRFIMKVVDNNGTSWIYGDIDTPLQFSYEDSNDGEASGETAYSLHFEGLCRLPALRLIV